jgi:hypothetical protein
MGCVVVGIAVIIGLPVAMTYVMRASKGLVLNKWNHARMAMSIRMLRALAWALLSFGLSASLAASEEYAAGGLIAYEPIALSLVRQDLHVSPDVIRVTYVLRSAEPERAIMAFPMPPVPVQGGPDFLGGAEINEDDPRNYMHSSVQADGKGVQPQIIESAYVGDLDVANALRASGLPLLPSPDSASDLIAALPAEQFYSLEESRIVSRGGDDPPHFTPLWSYQATMEWPQAFPIGETRIDLNYRPLTGVVENPLEFLRSPEMASKYCFGPELAEAAGDRAEVVTLSFLLTMPPFWTGQAGEYNLATEPSGEHMIAAHCSAEDVPAKTLDVAFIYPNGLP